jgi:hypothetical protein
LNNQKTERIINRLIKDKVKVQISTIYKVYKCEIVENRGGFISLNDPLAMGRVCIKDIKSLSW